MTGSTSAKQTAASYHTPRDPVLKTGSRGGRWDSSLRERAPFAVKCNPSLPPPCPPPLLAAFFLPQPPFLALDNKTTERQVFKTTTLPTCLPPQTQRPKDGDFEKYFLRKCGDFPGTDLTCINILYHLIRLLDNKTTYKKLLHTIRIHKNIHHMYTRNSFARSLSNCLPVLTQNPG